MASINRAQDDFTTHLDSHADTCVVGRNALIFQDFDRPVDVCGFDPEGPVTSSLRTVSAALAYTKPSSGEVIILVVHQAIEISSLSHNLLCPNQLRLNDVAVNEQPKFLTEQPNAETHTIRHPGDETESLPPLTIHLDLKGLTSYFPTRKPTPEEFDNCPRYELTADSPTFDPYDKSFASQEASFLDYKGQVTATGDRKQARRIFGVAITSPTDSDKALESICCTLTAGSFHQELGRSVPVSSIKTEPKGPAITAETLARNWGIGLEKAEKTIRVTTQRGVRTVLHPSLSTRYRTNDRQLRYRRLPIDLFTDTMKANVKSYGRGNRYAQVYCTPDGWTRAFPMKKRQQVHETVDLLFKRDGVPNAMIMDGAKEQILGQFRKECRSAGVHVRQTEPYTPFSNTTEAAIRELKKGVGRPRLCGITVSKGKRLSDRTQPTTSTD